MKRNHSKGVTEEQHITWELDGGNYAITEEAELFQGRLYPNRRALALAKLGYHGRGVARSLATFLPFMALFSGRS